jgi:hypothetical protein
MGKLLGAHATDELDRPDLNKCPDCGCFFDGDSCPLCGKECPEEMRAGNRAKVKPSRSRPNPNAGRVTFIAWYHTWLCIILCLFMMPILGIVLLCTSPHRTRTKVLVVVCILAGSLLMTLILPLATHFLFAGLLGTGDAALVDSSLSQAEYLEKCNATSANDFYRSTDAYDGKYLRLELEILDRITDVQAPGSAYSTYYVCKGAEDSDLRILVRDCVISGTHNFVAGDTVTFYGEGAGNQRVIESDMTVTDLPCINAAYATLVE